MKSILISIKPKYVADILNGIKKVEVRTTAPKDWKDYLSGKTKEMPEPIDVYIYCTKEDSLSKLIDYPKDRYVCEQNFKCDDFPKLHSGYEGKGKVVAKFTLNKVEEINLVNIEDYSHDTYEYQTDTMIQDELCSKSGLSGVELGDYLSKKLKGYAWHISNLEIFDKPKELSEFKKNNATGNCWKCKLFGSGCSTCQLTKAPQSMCYVEELE